MAMSQADNQSWKARRLINTQNFPKPYNKRVSHIVTGIARSEIDAIKRTLNSPGHVRSTHPIVNGKYTIYSLFIGERGAGKSEIVSAQVPGKYPWLSYEPSGFVRINKHKFRIMNVPVNLKSVEIPGADHTSGPPDREPWLPILYEQVSSIVLVFNFEDGPRTFIGMIRWYAFYVKPKFILNPGSTNDPAIFIVGTNYHSDDHRRAEARAMKFANTIGAEYWAVNIENGKDPAVDRFFDRLAAVSFHHEIGKHRDE